MMNNYFVERLELYNVFNNWMDEDMLTIYYLIFVLPRRSQFEYISQFRSVMNHEINLTG